MTSEEFKNEMLNQVKKLKDVPDKVLQHFYHSILILTNLDVVKVFIEYVKLEECLVIWLNIGHKILINIELDEDPIVTFTISCDGIVLVMDELPLKELVIKLIKIQNKLK